MASAASPPTHIASNLSPPPSIQVLDLAKTWQIQKEELTLQCRIDGAAPGTFAEVWRGVVSSRQRNIVPNLSHR